MRHFLRAVRPASIFCVLLAIPVLWDPGRYAASGLAAVAAALGQPRVLASMVAMLGLAALLRLLERRRGTVFEWSFPALLGLNLLLALPGLDRLAPSVRPLTAILLPGMVALQVALFLLPPAWKSGAGRLTEHRHFAKILFLLLLGVYGLVAIRITLAKGFHAGDELYYMRQAETIARFGTFDMRAAIPELKWTEESFGEHHISLASRTGQAHTHHPFGLPLLMAPGFWLLGRWGALLVFVALSALLGPVLFRLLRHEGNDARISAGVTLFFSLSLPILIYAVRTYPELLAGICYLWVYDQIRHRKNASGLAFLPAGLVLGYTSWLLTRRCFVPMAVLDLVAIARFYRARDGKAAVAFILPQLALVGSVVLINLYRFAGNPIFEISPDAALSGGAGGALRILMNLANTMSLSPVKLDGVLFDRRFGLVWVNVPLTLLILASLVTAFRYVRTQWAPHAIFWGMYVLINGTHIWAWPAGVCHPPRYILAVLPFLAPAFARMLGERPWTGRHGGLRVAGLLAALSLAGILLKPFRFDTPYVAFTRLKPGLASLANALPWHPSYQFYDGPVDPVQIAATAAGFAVLAALCFSRRASRLSSANFFLILLALAAGLDLLAQRGA